MPSQKSSKVIFDTNIWISFLIGKQLSFVTDLIASKQITVIVNEQLFAELEIVTKRPKLQKYFQQEKVQELIMFLRLVGEVYDNPAKHTLCRDEKDNFLLDLVDISKADYLVTGDKDLIELNPFKTAQIITPKQFEDIEKR
jgi:putative PIN family toxin of toxin-antitoxin system